MGSTRLVLELLTTQVVLALLPSIVLLVNLNLRIMKGFHVICVGVFTLVSPILAQLKFSGGVSSGGSNSSSVSGSQDANKKLFGITSGNEAIDGGIVGLGLGALGATVLG